MGRKEKAVCNVSINARVYTISSDLYDVQVSPSVYRYPYPVVVAVACVHRGCPSSPQAAFAEAFPRWEGKALRLFENFKNIENISPRFLFPLLFPSLIRIFSFPLSFPPLPLVSAFSLGEHFECSCNTLPRRNTALDVEEEEEGEEDKEWGSGDWEGGVSVGKLMFSASNLYFASVFKVPSMRNEGGYASWMEESMSSGS